MLAVMYAVCTCGQILQSAQTFIMICQPPDRHVHVLNISKTVAICLQSRMQCPQEVCGVNDGWHEHCREHVT